MIPSSRTPEGKPNRCPLCGHEVVIEPSTPPGDATCPFCGSLLWFDREAMSGSVDGKRDQSNPGREMRPLARCFSLDGKILDIQATTKRDVIEEMVGALVSSGRLLSDQQESVVAAIMTREELGSTGIGRGVAIPHAKHVAVTECTGLIGQSKSGVDFAALGGEPVRLICLLISPPDRPGDHLRMLESVSRTLRDNSFRLL